MDKFKSLRTGKIFWYLSEGQVVKNCNFHPCFCFNKTVGCIIKTKSFHENFHLHFQSFFIKKKTLKCCCTSCVPNLFLQARIFRYFACAWEICMREIFVHGWTCWLELLLHLIFCWSLIGRQTLWNVLLLSPRYAFDKNHFQSSK